MVDEGKGGDDVQRGEEDKAIGEDAKRDRVPGESEASLKSRCTHIIISVLLRGLLRVLCPP